MSDNTFSPGPIPSTVKSAAGKVLTVPEGWALLPPGHVGNIPLVYVSFERVHVLPLIMPAFGLMIVLALLFGRRSLGSDRVRVA